MDEIREKIEKLLALSGSSNEYEAKAALLKAHELMRKHNVEELGEDDGQEVVTLALPMNQSDVKMYAGLPSLIAYNFRCLAYSDKTGIEFLGFQDDAYAALKCMEFMVSEITRGWDEYFKKFNSHERIYIPTRERREMKREWIRGFSVAIKEAFCERANDPKYEIMLIIPDEVRRIYTTLSLRQNAPYRVETNVDAYNEGYMNGERAVRNKRIEE
jgi:hypothetical protein